MDEFLKALNAHFEANQDAFTDQGFAPIATIDKYRGQPIDPQKFDLFPLPAMFINRSITWVLEGKYYTGTMSLEFHLVQDATYPTESFATNIDEGLKQYRYLQIVRSLLDGFESMYTSKLQRVQEVPVDADVVIYDMLTYQCNYYEPLPVGKKYTDTTGDNVTVDGKIVRKVR